MERLLASFDAIPLDDKSVDAVMFNFAICHSDNWQATLTEASRVLRDDGVLLINDMQRTHGDNDLMAKYLKACAFSAAEVVEVAERCGFVLRSCDSPAVVVNRFDEVYMDRRLKEATLDGLAPAVWTFSKRVAADPVASAFARHKRIAFQFSGGRDSTAALYLLRAYWSRMTVIHLDTGDQFPETREVVAAVGRDLLAAGVDLVVIHSDVNHYREQVGLASDLVPVDNMQFGRLVSGREVKIVGRYECCAKNLMLPMNQTMLERGITLLVRGQRDDEYAKPPMRSGDVQDGFEVLYPIQSWNGEQVSKYLTDNNLPLAEFYERGARRAPECMGCTAWWDEGRAEYLKQYHPAKFEAFRARMKVIRIEIDRQYAFLND
jgi:phosphoadenosine phosphosulfate reductase